MVINVAVIYATKYGSTKEIAEIIAENLMSADFKVDLIHAKKCTSLGQYHVIILGSAIYMGSWRKDAVNCIKTNLDILKQKTVWLFSSGPTGDGDPSKLLKGWTLPENVKLLADKINPRGMVVFHGQIDLLEVNLLERFIIKMVKVPVGDFRRMDEIKIWTDSIIRQIHSNI